MKKKLIKFFMIPVFVLTIMVGLVSGVDAAYSRSVLKSYKYDFNTYTFISSNYHDYVYINVADDARSDGQTNEVVDSGWNYRRFKTTYYYKNADMNW